MDLTQKILSDVVVFNKYAKYIPELSRRETWEELCNRNRDMHLLKFPELAQEIYAVYDDFIKPKKILPSMRSLQFGGRPIELSNIRLFNCAFLTIDTLEAFSETLFLLLSGTGVGYSVQKRHISQLPIVVGPTPKSRRYLIEDSIAGWADALKVLFKAYFQGKANPVFDFRDIRPKGARLITSGGKAPGPEPLKVCLEKVRQILDGAVGRQMHSLEIHDALCHEADAVLSGGIRRAAMIALFSHDDEDMLTCKGNLPLENWEFEKDGDSYRGFCIYQGKRHDLVLSQWDYDNLSKTSKLPWYFLAQQRGRANNSAVLHREFTSKQDFMQIWEKVEASQAGEPGIYWTNNYDWGTNPCCEIGLRPYQCCNLAEINVSNVENQEDLNARVKAAAFLGTLQASYTDFYYLRSIWKETAEKDALLGIGMTGIGSGRVEKLDLSEAAEIAKTENVRVADIIGINHSARITCIKPSGTTSCVVGSSSGVHAWHNDYYIRRMRVGKNEALYTYMKAMLPELVEDCVFKPHLEAVLSFPQKAPEGAIYRTEPFLDLLERVKHFNKKWVFKGHVDGANSHNVSCTISLKDDEWAACGDWMWKNRNFYNGISVLPYDGGTYIQAPFEDITKARFDEMVGYLKDIDLTQVKEEADITDHKMEPACAGGVCEI